MQDEIIQMPTNFELVKAGTHFSKVLKKLRKTKGSRAFRKGWNGKGIFVYYMPGYPDGVACNEATATALWIELGDKVKVHPYLGIRTAQNTVGPWRPTQPDLFSKDWVIIKPEAHPYDEVMA